MGTYCKMFLSICKFMSIKRSYLRAKSSATISSIVFYSKAQKKLQNFDQSGLQLP